MAISGKDGDIKIGGTTQVSEITKYKVTPKSMVFPYASNKTGGFKKRVVGVRDLTFTADFKWDPANPLSTSLPDGSSVSLTFVIDANSHTLTVPSIIESFDLEEDLNDGSIVGGTITGGSNGAWTWSV